MSTVTKISDKGQLVIPKQIREKAELKKGDSVTIYEADGVIIIKKAKTIFDIARTVKVSESFNVEKAIEATQEEIANEKLRGY
jgi:AbrB family looped-hinge helix DNA binding protein